MPEAPTSRPPPAAAPAAVAIPGCPRGRLAGGRVAAAAAALVTLSLGWSLVGWACSRAILFAVALPLWSPRGRELAAPPRTGWSPRWSGRAFALALRAAGLAVLDT